MIRSLALAAVLLLGLSLPTLAQSGGDPPPAAALTVSCNGFTCTLDASASADNGTLTYAWDCNKFPVFAPCYDPRFGNTPVFVTQSSVTVTYPNDGGNRTPVVTVRDTAGQTSSASVTFQPGATPTPLPTSTATTPPTNTSTATPTATDTPTQAPTDTPTPTSTATETPTSAPASSPIPFGMCPGQFAGLIVVANTMTMTCVKPTTVPWPWETPQTVGG